MEKIKAIYDRLHKTPFEYIGINLLIAKNTFAFFAFLYFTGFLFTIGGFSFWPMTLVAWSAFIYYLFPVFLGSALWLIYSLVNYAYTILFPALQYLKYIIGVLLGILWLGAVIIHLNVIPFS